MDSVTSSFLPHAVMRECGTRPGETALLIHALTLYTVQIQIIDERFTIGPRKPNFSLIDVKSAAERKDGLYLSKTRAEVSFSSPSDALAAARKMIAMLAEKDFVESKHQNPDLCDVYSIRIDSQGWYVKSRFCGERVFLISFHRPEHPIRTARGHEVIP